MPYTLAVKALGTKVNAAQPSDQIKTNAPISGGFGAPPDTNAVRFGKKSGPWWHLTDDKPDAASLVVDQLETAVVDVPEALNSRFSFFDHTRETRLLLVTQTVADCARCQARLCPAGRR